MAIIITFSIGGKVKLRNGTPFIGYSVLVQGLKRLPPTDLNKEFKLFTGRVRKFSIFKNKIRAVVNLKLPVYVKQNDNVVCLI